MAVPFCDLVWLLLFRSERLRSGVRDVKRVYFCYPPHGDRLLEAATNVTVAARAAGVEAVNPLGALFALNQERQYILVTSIWIVPMV